MKLGIEQLVMRVSPARLTLAARQPPGHGEASADLKWVFIMHEARGAAAKAKGSKRS